MDSSPRFATTQWSVVLAAQQEHSPEALDSLCRAYWYPLYAYVRRSGFDPHDAQDLTQEFFARLLAKEYLQSVDRERGRFRTFLLVAMQRFLANMRRHRAAAKRGGDRATLSLDCSVGEKRYAFEPANLETPEKLFERRWALTLLEHVLQTLGKEFDERGRGELFRSLGPCLLQDETALGYADIADGLGMSVAAVKVAAHRLRERFRTELRAQVSATVASEEEVDDELRYLMEAVSDR